jgi:serine/threonine-protein kinase RsbW
MICLKNATKNSERWAHSVSKSSAVQIQSNLNDINKFVTDVLISLKSLSISESVSFDIRLSLEEALINAMKHGNKNNPALAINIDYSVSDNMFKVSVQDSGNGFDYKQLPNPTVEENLLKAKGRGVYLIRHLMDEVSFNRSGNKITMIKYLRRPNADK